VADILLRGCSWYFTRMRKITREIFRILKYQNTVIKHTITIFTALQKHPDVL